MAPNNSVRIIAGQWRGSKLTFGHAPDLRPTPDRIRETLFNWLQNDISNARCLDLFSGSGALGFEALSRGARQVIFVDEQRDVISHLTSNAERLRAAGAEIVHCAADHYLKRTSTPFDIVFLDPPFRTDFAATICSTLESNAWLAQNGWIYLESPSDREPPQTPTEWHLHRDKHAGAVRYQLFQRREATAKL